MAMSQGDVARILWQIEQEYESSRQGLHGTALGTSRHAFITSKMERIGGLHEELKNLVGDQAIALIAEHIQDLEPDKTGEEQCNAEYQGVVLDQRGSSLSEDQRKHALQKNDISLH